MNTIPEFDAIKHRLIQLETLCKSRGTIQTTFCIEKINIGWKRTGSDGWMLYVIEGDLWRPAKDVSVMLSMRLLAQAPVIVDEIARAKANAIKEAAVIVQGFDRWYIDQAGVE